MDQRDQDDEQAVDARLHRQAAIALDLEFGEDEREKQRTEETRAMESGADVGSAQLPSRAAREARIANSVAAASAPPALASRSRRARPSSATLRRRPPYTAAATSTRRTARE
jgi:hypothetical protein